MKFIKKFEKFISESVAEPDIKPSKPKTSPSEPSKRPNAPSPIPGERISPIPTPAKARLKKATALDVSNKFIQLINKSGDDIKKYIEKK